MAKDTKNTGNADKDFVKEVGKYGDKWDWQDNTENTDPPEDPKMEHKEPK